MLVGTVSGLVFPKSRFTAGVVPAEASGIAPIKTTALAMKTHIYGGARKVLNGSI